MAGYIHSGSVLTIGQSRIAKKLTARFRNVLLQHGLDPTTLDLAIRRPIHRKPPLASADIPREIRYLGDDLLGFRFKSNPLLQDALARCSNEVIRDGRSWAHPETRVAVLPVHSGNIERIIDLIEANRFSLDEGAADFIETVAGGGGVRVHRVGDEIQVSAPGNEIVGWLMRRIRGCRVLDHGRYGLPDTPHIAGRLATLAALVAMDIDEPIEVHRAATPIERASECLLQNDLRGLVLCARAWEARCAVVTAVAAQNAFPMVVATRNPRAWATQMTDRVVTCDPQDHSADIVLVDPDDLVDQDLLSRRRHGTLVIDTPRIHRFEATFGFQGPAREVARTIVIAEPDADAWDPDNYRQIARLLPVLFKRPEIDLLDQSSATITALRSQGVRHVRRQDLYPLFGIVTELS